ncbi:DUF881 domain-containing protein [Janibacter corallicola]|uniref:DUF881 domain-containing protein n=1 Tax=Janibacter corallicola TaxID=415212 RepID=UPI00082AE89C|nr:DUF881 domain-containing protein [Janibacter corallicola]
MSQQRADTPEKSGRRRPPHPRTWLTRRPTAWSALVPVIALGAGVLFATSGTAARGTDLRTEQTGLSEVIRDRTIENERSEEQVQEVRSQVDRLSDRDSKDPEHAGVDRLVQKRTRAAGLSAVKGPAVTVSLDDADLGSDEIPEGYGVNDVVVHQQDVQGVVNALWRGGAEAMQIMDQRVVSTSAVRCVGNTLILQGRVYSPPFTITAVGDTDGMRTELDEDPAVSIYREYVDAVGLGYDVSVQDEVTLPAFSGDIRLEHARPAPDGQ